MKVLLRAALKAKRHFFWVVFSFLTLFGCTIADQIELMTLGSFVNTGSDLFSLFGDKQEITREEYVNKFDELDREGRGRINSSDTSLYLSEAKDAGVIKRLLESVKRTITQRENKVSVIISVLFFIGLFKAFFLFFSRYTTRVLSVKISRDLRQQYFEHIQKLSMSFYGKYNIGTLSSRVVADSFQIAQSINSWLTNYLHTPFILISTFSLCLFFNWQLSLSILFAMPIMYALIRFVSKKIKKVTRRLQKNQENFANVLFDFLAGIQTVKIFSMERFTRKKYQEQNDEMEYLECKTHRIDLMTKPILHFLVSVILISVVFVGLYIMQMQLAELLVFCGLLHLFYDPIRRFADENANVQRGVVAAERLFEVLQMEPEITDREDAVHINTFSSSLIFNEVEFGYDQGNNESDGEVAVLKKMSFEVKKGQSVAIIGATGAGKSTILQLISRLYEVKQGMILLDGLPLTSYSQKSLRSLISYAPQKPFLFNDTVKANIAYGKDLSDEEIEAAAKKAHAHEFIVELSDGYDTRLAEMGKSLSGGQMQRLSLARALAKKAPILLLDEATSSLDSISEGKIKQAIRELHGEITQIIVAHRLSTVAHVDKIIVIDKGRKVSAGTKEELLANCSMFKAMWDAAQYEPIESIQ